jgi:transposase
MMESMGKKKRRARREFTLEFKAEIVELCQRGDRSIPQVVADFDLVDSAVRRWVAQAEIDTGQRSGGPTTDEKAEVAALRAENRRLREDNAILKRAMVFFAREIR